VYDGALTFRRSQAGHWGEGDAIPNRYRPELERRLFADGMREGDLITAQAVERVWPKAQFLRETTR